MKKAINPLRITAIAAIILFIASGCASLFHSVTIRTDNNLSSVLAGGTLNLRASGRDIVWSVSSNPSGTGPVANGTYITQNGVLSVAVNESSLILYVMARSLKDTNFSDIKEIRVVTVTGVAVTPTNQPVAIGRTLQLRAQVTGNNNPDHAATWRVSSNAAGTGSVTPGTSINANGLLTVASNESLRTLYVTATSVVDPTKASYPTPITVVVPTITQILISPSNQTMAVGATQQFTVSVLGTHEPDNTVTWAVSSNTAGTGAVTPGTSINSRGLLTVSRNESLPTLYVIATSTYDPTKTHSVPVNVIIPVVTSVTVSPANHTLQAGSSFQFVASVAGINNPNTAVTWRVSSNAAGSGAVTPGTNISANGLLTISVNETARNLFVFATSVFDPTKSSSVAVNVIAAPQPPVTQPPVVQPPVVQPPVVQPPVVQPPVTQPPVVQPPVVTQPTVTSVTVNPSSQTITRGSTIQFGAAVTGTNNPSTAVTWRVGSNMSGSGSVASGTRINSSGLLTIASNETRTTLYVVATSTADTSKSGRATVTVNRASGGGQDDQGQDNNAQ